MKRDSLDEALRRKLHDAEAGLPVPPWAEMQRRMQLHANAHPAERVPLFRSWSRYAAAAVVLLGIGLGVWRVQRTHSWGEKSMAETVALPLPVSGSDSASRTAPAFNDTALNRIMKSARSVRLIDPRSKASTALLASLSDGAGAPSGNSSPSRDNTDNASATGSDMSSQPDRSAETAPNRELIAAYERKFAQTDAPLKRRGGRSKGWSASLYANASTFSNALSASGSSPMLLIQNAGLADIGSMRVESPVFEDSHMDHKFPVSVGFSVHKYLTPRLHIGTGLVYTYMSSKAEIEGAFNYRYRQRLHYLGIPLTVNVPYGYVKDPNDPHHWLIDPEAAQVVKKIFTMCMEGRGPSQIANQLRAGRPNCTRTGLSFRPRLARSRPTALCGRSIWVWASVSIWWIISVFMWNRRSAIISRTSASLHPIGRKILGTSIWAWDSAINSDVSPRFALPDATFCPGCASYIVNSVL